MTSISLLSVGLSTFQNGEIRMLLPSHPKQPERFPVCSFLPTAGEWLHACSLIPHRCWGGEGGHSLHRGHGASRGFQSSQENFLPGARPGMSSFGGVGLLTKSDYHRIGNKDVESVAKTTGEACSVKSLQGVSPSSMPGPLSERQLHLTN